MKLSLVWLRAAAIILSFLGVTAFAQTPDISIVNTVTAAMSAASQTILSQAILWLSSFVALQFVVTNVSLLKSGADLEAVWAKFLGSLLWFGFCFYVLTNGPAFIDSVGNGVLGKFAPNIPGPGTIITATLGLSAALLTGIVLVGVPIVGHTALASLLTYVLVAIFVIGMYLAIKIFMLQLELGMVVLLSPLSFSFLGINAMKDQGIAPFKSLISLVYRIILLGIICSAFGEVVRVVSTQLNSLNWGNPLTLASAVTSVLSGLTAFPVLAFLVYKSDSIASSLAGGGSSLGTSDMASAAAMGAAAGAAVATAGASAASAAATAPQSMADFMKGIGGNASSISNASGMGSGGNASALPAAPEPVASLASSSPVAGVTGGRASEASAPPGTVASSDIAKLSPQGKNAAGVQNAAVAAGANPAVAKAASDAAYEGASPSGIAAAASNAGGTPEQSAAAASASTNVGAAAYPDNSAPAAAGGSGANAGISGVGSAGAGNKLEETLGNLAEQMAKQNETKKPKLGDAASAFNQHLAQEKSHTSVSISTHHAD
jgi:type IV secretion system protein TrbL